jgi:hypothetical protein
MSLFDWVGFKSRLMNVQRELQAIVDELEPLLKGDPDKEINPTTGKLAKVMESQIKLAKIVLRIVKALPS